jgi:hypothetical protein
MSTVGSVVRRQRVTILGGIVECVRIMSLLSFPIQPAARYSK